jgi:hypothetical protein
MDAFVGSVLERRADSPAVSAIAPAGDDKMGDMWQNVIRWNAAMSTRTCPILKDLLPNYYVDFPRLGNMIGKQDIGLISGHPKCVGTIV